MHAEFLADGFGFFTIGIMWRDGMKFAEHFFATGGKERDQSPRATLAGTGRVRHAARQQDGGAGISGDVVLTHDEIHVTFHDVKDRVFLGMEMNRNSGAGSVALFNQRESAAGLEPSSFNVWWSPMTLSCWPSPGRTSTGFESRGILIPSPMKQLANSK